MSSILHLQNGDWKQVESSAKPVLVDFWAEWCGPCRMLAPTFEKLAQHFGDEITFAKVDVDELPDVAGRYGVRSIPTLILFRQGKVAETVVGLESYQELAAMLARYVPQPARPPVAGAR
jgi:thioredoxin